MSDEQWRPVVGFEDTYVVSDHGQVMSLPRTVRGPHGSTCVRAGRLRKLRLHKRGYLTVILTAADGTKHSKQVHCLVLEAFVGPRPEGLMGCHGPGGQQDNHVGNLRWDTQSNNVRDQLKYGTHPSGATEDSCGRGHVRTAENTYWKRGCRDCDSTTRLARKAG